METKKKPALGAIRRFAEGGPVKPAPTGSLRWMMNGAQAAMANVKDSMASKPAPAAQAPAAVAAPATAAAPVLNIRTYAANTALDKRMQNADNMKVGGAVRGPGTGTSDEVPIMASNGEFVIKAKAVKEIGLPTLHALNEIADAPAVKAGSKPGGAIRKMATGGEVGADPLPADTYIPAEPPPVAPGTTDAQVEAHKKAAASIPDTFRPLGVPTLGGIPGFKRGGAIRKMATGGLVEDDAVDRVNRLNAARAPGGAMPSLAQIGAASAPSNPSGGATPVKPASDSVVSQIPTGGVPGAGPTPALGESTNPQAAGTIPATPAAAPTPAAPGRPGGAIRMASLQPTTAAAPAVAAGALPKPANQVTRIGNSYSGGPGISGDISLVDAGGNPAPAGGAISSLNNQAAENLARRYGQTSDFGTATSGGGTVSTVPGMSQAKIDATLTNPDGTRWTAQDQATMAANVRDGVDPYRGTSRAQKTMTVRDRLATMGDATTRRGQDISANIAKANLDAHTATQKATNDIAQKKLTLDEQRAALDDAQKVRIAQLDEQIISGTPEQQKRAAEQKASLMGKGPADGKALAGPVLKQLQETRDNAATISNLNQSFKDDFASKGLFGVGAEAQLGASANMGVDKDAVEWWKNYKKQSELVERHALFGASLTPGEQDSWRAADIGPGMNKDVIKKNLETRAALSKRVFENTRQDLIDAGHSDSRINAIASRGAPAAPVDAASHASLPSGTIYTTPNGEVRRKK